MQVALRRRAGAGGPEEMVMVLVASDLAAVDGACEGPGDVSFRARRTAARVTRRTADVERGEGTNERRNNG